MNKELSSLLKKKLLTLPFIDVLAGMVQTVTRDNMQEDDGIGKTTKRFPVSYDTNLLEECLGRPEKMLIPDSSRKSIIYFEDYGIVNTDKKHGLYGYNSSVRLICWMNRALLVGDVYAEISGRCMAMIIERLAGHNPENNGLFTELRVDVARIPPQDAALFGRYTYNEQDRQYLRPPYEFFGIDFSCRYYVNSKCLNETQWNQQICY